MSKQHHEPFQRHKPNPILSAADSLLAMRSSQEKNLTAYLVQLA